MTSPILSVSNLTTSFRVEGQWRPVVRNVSFDVLPKQTVALVGESGSGKSVTALSVMRLTPRDSSKVEGSVKLDGRELLTLPNAEMRNIRGNEVAMIFQEPMTSLNPVLTIGEQIAEAVRIHQGLGDSEARARAAEMLQLVRIPDATQRLDDYPPQFSGGMRQRVMIAMALCCNPRLLIADEPTTALDVTIQAQILNLIVDLKDRTGAAVVMITHDLGVVAATCQRVIVLYAGRKIEEAPVEALFDHPLHPYTRGLMASIPRIGGAHGRERLNEIPGIVPSLREPIEGCPFAPRCPLVHDRCRIEAPELRMLEPGHLVACHVAERGFAEARL